MAEDKTRITDAPVEAYLARVAPERRVADAPILIELMARHRANPRRRMALRSPASATIATAPPPVVKGNAALVLFPARGAARPRGGANHKALLPTPGKLKTGGG